MFHFWLCLLCLFAGTYSSRNDDNAYLMKNEAPDPGPEMDTVYIPGNSGAPWTKEEIDSTRLSFIYLIFLK